MLLHVVCSLFFSCKSIWLKFQSKELCHLPVISLFCWVNIFAMCYTWGKLFLCSPFSHLNSNWHPLLGSPKRPVWHNCSHGWIACTLSACLSVCFKEQNKFTILQYCHFSISVVVQVEHPQWWKLGKVCVAQSHDKLEHGQEHTGRRIGQEHLPHYKMEYGQKHHVWGSIKRCHALRHWGSPCLGNTIPSGLQNKPQFHISKQSQLGIL